MSKKFQPLDYSRGWDDYWRDHPQGYSPQEQMVNWSGQLNAMIDFFNQYFDVDLTEYATDVMEGWYFDGRLVDIINEALFDSKADKTTVNALIDRLAEIALNVKSLGAAGDGITNDTQYIKQALNTKQNIFFPDGDYLIDDGFIIDSPLNIIFSKKAKLVLASDNLTTNSIFDIKTDNVYIENLNIDGMGYEVPLLHARDGAINHKNLIINGGNIENIGNALAEGDVIRLHFFHYSTIKNLTFRNTKGKGVALLGCIKSKIEDCQNFSGGLGFYCGRDVTTLIGSKDCVIDNVVVENCSIAGVKISRQAENTLLTNSKIHYDIGEEPEGYPVFIQGAKGTRVENNHITADYTTTTRILLRVEPHPTENIDSENVVIKGNKIKGIVTAISSRVNADQTVRNLTIEDNEIDTTKDSIVVDCSLLGSTLEGLFISSNIFSNSQRAVFIQGSSNANKIENIMINNNKYNSVLERHSISLYAKNVSIDGFKGAKATRRNSAFTIQSGIDTPLEFDTKEFDTHDFYNNSDKMIIPSGIDKIKVQAGVVSNTMQDTTKIIIKVVVNSSIYAQRTGLGTLTTGTIDVVEGDEIQLIVNHNQESSMNISASRGTFLNVEGV